MICLKGMTIKRWRPEGGRGGQKYINTALERSRYYREINVLEANLIAQGFIYEGLIRNNAVYRFRFMLPSSISSGLKIADILPADVKERSEFNKWYMENKDKLPRVYEIEVTIFRGKESMPILFKRKYMICL